MINNHNENMPQWAQRIDSYGRNHWHREKKIKSHRGEYIGAIISNLIFLWIFNNVQEWHLGFIKDSFSVVLWILNVNCLIQIAGNILILMLEFPVIRYLARIITESAGFVTQMVIFYIFPFEFTNFHGLFWLDWFIPVALIIGMVISAIKVLSNLWKLIFWRS